MQVLDWSIYGPSVTWPFAFRPFSAIQSVIDRSLAWALSTERHLESIDQICKVLQCSPGPLIGVRLVVIKHGNDGCRVLRGNWSQTFLELWRLFSVKNQIDRSGFCCKQRPSCGLLGLNSRNSNVWNCGCLTGLIHAQDGWIGFVEFETLLLCWSLEK